MFTGLVEALGTIGDTRPDGADGAGRYLEVIEPRLAAELAIGDSVAVNGVCLTVVQLSPQSFGFQAVPETLRCTNLGELSAGCRVNLERALAVGDRLGGHIVQGHVDGLARIARREKQRDGDMMWFDCAPELARQLIAKGAIAVDGVSLTLVDVIDAGFSIALIPHTLQMTTLGFKPAGATVNIEIDLFGKYIWKYLQQLSANTLTDRASR